MSNEMQFILMMVLGLLGMGISINAYNTGKGSLTILAGILMTLGIIFVVGMQPAYGAPNGSPGLVRTGWIMLGISVVSLPILRFRRMKQIRKSQKAYYDATLRRFQSEEASEKTLAAKRGIDKLNSQWYSLKSAQQEAAKALGTLSTAVRSPAYQTKEVDWAIAGGLASGLGGPLAGAATAVDAMGRNAQIRADNARNRAYVNQVADNMTSSFYDGLRQSNDWLRDIKRYYAKARISNAETGETLFNHLNVRTLSTQVDPTTGSVTVVATFDCDNDHLWIDGSVRGILYSGSREAGTVYLNLPLGGTMVNTSVVHDTMEGHLAVPTIKSSGYTIKYVPNNLWRMEA